jgi:hypothetical protein
MNGCYCVTIMIQGPYGLLRLHGHLRLTYLDCCVAWGRSGLAILHPYCLRMWVSYDRVQVTAQQECGCQVTLYSLFYCTIKVLFSVGRGSTFNMYLNHSDLGTYSPVLSSTWIDYIPSLLHSKTCWVQDSRFGDQWKTPLHFSPSLRPNKPLTLALVCNNTFGPTDHLQWVRIGYLRIWSYLVCMWKPPCQTKGKVLRKTLQVLVHSRRGP